MADLSELYQQLIIEHNRSPRNFRTLPDANRSAEGDNPLCGDRIILQVRLDDGVIRDIGFQGSGCAISRASASLMTSAVQGRTAADAEKLFQAFHGMVTAHPDAPVDTVALGKLAALSGVRRFPGRVKCATMAWHTLQSAISGSGR
jgi:nitrogen fixation NifU-like protein